MLVIITRGVHYVQNTSTAWVNRNVFFVMSDGGDCLSVAGFDRKSLSR